MDRLSGTEISAKQREPWRQPKTSHESIAKLLTVLALSRQTVMEEAAMKTFARGLDGFLLQDIQHAVSQLCLQDAPAGKTSMPSLGAMVTACQAASRHRFEAESLAKQAQESQYVREHPDRFCSWKELMSDMQMMRDTVEVAFGGNWRDHPLMLEKGMDGKHRYGLADMYDLAVRP